jgi:hypothetical protein
MLAPLGCLTHRVSPPGRFGDYPQGRARPGDAPRRVPPPGVASPRGSGQPSGALTDSGNHRFSAIGPPLPASGEKAGRGEGSLRPTPSPAICPIPPRPGCAHFLPRRRGSGTTRADRGLSAGIRRCTPAAPVGEGPAPGSGRAGQEPCPMRGLSPGVARAAAPGSPGSRSGRSRVGLVGLLSPPRGQTDSAMPRLSGLRRMTPSFR